MSEVSTAKATHQGKDGLWYKSYEEMCEANKQHNQRRLEKLGLADTKADIQAMLAKRAAFSAKRRAMKQAKLNEIMKEGKLRRSARVRKLPPGSRTKSTRRSSLSAASDGVVGDNDDDDDDEEEDEYDSENSSSSRPTKKFKTVRRRKKYEQLSEEDRRKLEHVPDWFKEMHYFLLNVPQSGGGSVNSNGSVCSIANARSVMRQVQRLVAGVGVTYHHWPEGVVFLPNTSVNLTMDFIELHRQAVAFEEVHGKDKGNGWLLRHPIRKLELFQKYKLQQMQEKDREEEEEEEEDDEKEQQSSEIST